MEADSTKSEEVGRGAESGWKRFVPWLPVLALGLITVELTADPALGVLVVCLKLGGRDFGTALWLRRVDPDRVRGRACSWFYVTSACVRVGGVALLVLLATFALVSGLGLGPRPVQRQLLSAVLILFACYGLAAVSSWIAVAAALRHGVRVWVDATAHRARRAGMWPPYLPGAWRRSSLGPGVVALYSMMSGLIATMVVGMIAMAALSLRWRATPSFAFLVIPIGLVAPVSLPMAMGFLSRINAATPRECYPEA